MTDRSRPPMWAYDDSSPQTVPGVDSTRRTFWFPSSDPTKFPWDLKGRYAIGSDGTVVILDVGVVTRSDAGAVDQVLDTNRVHRLTALAPIKRAIYEEEKAVAARVKAAHAEAVELGHPSVVLDRWVQEIESHPIVPVRRGRPPSADWSLWALDYISMVQERGTAYGVQPDLADRWGVSYNTVRDRIKKMRSAGWIKGEGHLVGPGPLLDEARVR